MHNRALRACMRTYVALLARSLRRLPPTYVRTWILYVQYVPADSLLLLCYATAVVTPALLTFLAIHAHLLLLRAYFVAEILPSVHHFPEIYLSHPPK